MGFKRTIMRIAVDNIAEMDGITWADGPFTEDGDDFIVIARSEKIYRITIERVV